MIMAGAEQSVVTAKRYMVDAMMVAGRTAVYQWWLQRYWMLNEWLKGAHIVAVLNHSDCVGIRWV